MKTGAFSLLRGWVLISAFFSLLGWILAWSGHFDAPGYLLGLVVGGILFVLWLRREFRSGEGTLRLGRGWRRRWRRPLPLVFAVLFALVTTGAVLYPPNNYDALTYRVPQILHWLDAGRWHWIATSDPHMNMSPPGYGWFMAPAIALLHTDRLFALPNVLAFAFLPGLYFSVLRGCGVRGRVAWHWMWLVPTASCLAMQAGGMASDLLPTVYALASLALGFRAAQRGDLEDFWFSALAVALVTGVKITAAPLALVWVVVTLPCWKLLRTRWLGSLAVAAVALLISYLPTAVENTLNTGSWTGDPNNETKLRIDSPIAGVVGNSLMILTGALEPTICPVARAVKAKLHRLDDTAFVKWIHEGFPRFDLSWGEMSSEEGSGVGLSLFTLAVASAVAGRKKGHPAPKKTPEWGRWAGLATGVAFLAYLAKMGSEAAPRLATPFYPFLLIPVLRGRGQEWLTRRRWWRVVALLAAISILPPAILTPSRPLWPAQSALGRLAAHAPGNAMLQRARDVYAVYASRYDYLAPMKALLPSTARTIGFIPTGNDLEGTLWRPYGKRRYIEILTPSPADPALAQLRASAIIASQRGIVDHFETTPEAYIASIHGRVIGQGMLAQKVSIGLEKWFVIALDGPAQ